MAETSFDVRIQLKYDSYENWISNDPVLKKGEVAIATIASTVNTEGSKDKGLPTEPPATLIKVGDGTSNYSALQFLSAKAADVHAYAKKPEAEFKAWIKEIISTEGAYDAAGSAADALEAAKDYADEIVADALAEAKEYADGLASNYAEAEHTHTMDEVTGLNDALAGKQDVGDYATKAEAKGYADAKDTAIAAAKSAADTAQNEVSALELVVADKANKTEVYAKTETYSATEIDNKVSTINEASGALANRVTATETAIEKINGTGDGSIAKAVEDAKTIVNKYTDDKIAELLNNDSEAVDSIMELAQAMSDNKDAIDALTEIAGTKATKEELAAVQKAVNDQAASDATTYETKTDAVAKLEEAKGYTDTVKGNLETEIAKKANSADLATVATTGLIDDLEQGENIIVFNCGDSSNM